MPAEALSAVIALGNPGRAYRMTRHNLGYMVADRLAGSQGVRFRRRYKSYYARLTLNDRPIVLAKPRTYMNDSGRAVTAVTYAFDVNVGDLIVVCDDINLSLGKMRFRSKGSSGGHRGLESIADALGTSDFARLRVGIGDPGGRDPRDYVLDRFTDEELPAIEEAVGKAVEGLAVWITEGIEEAMNRFN
jgi:PTH1 family peptidyl-tRNA hydrolase